MHAYFWRDRCQDQRRSSRYKILGGQQPESNAGPVLECRSELKKREEKVAFSTYSTFQAGLQSLPRRQNSPYCWHNFLTGPCLHFFSFTATKQPFISSQQIFAVHSLCAKPYTGVEGEQVWLFLFKDETYRLLGWRNTWWLLVTTLCCPGEPHNGAVTAKVTSCDEPSADYLMCSFQEGGWQSTETRFQ